MPNHGASKPKPHNKFPGHEAKTSPGGDKAPVAVSGPEAWRREKPQPEDPNARPEEEGDAAPVAVAGPEAQAREKK